MSDWEWEHLEDLPRDLRRALREGWLQAYELATFCQYCHNNAGYSAEVKGYLCEHAPDCLMTKYARLVGDVNDHQED